MKQPMRTCVMLSLLGLSIFLFGQDGGQCGLTQNGDTDTNTNTGADTNTNTNPDSDTNTDTNTNTDTDTNAGTGASLPGAFRSVFSVPDPGCVDIGGGVQVCGESRVDRITINERCTGEVLADCAFGDSDTCDTGPSGSDGSQFWCARRQDASSGVTEITVSSNQANLPMISAWLVRKSDGLPMWQTYHEASGGLLGPGGAVYSDPYQNTEFQFAGYKKLTFTAQGKNYDWMVEHAVTPFQEAGYDVQYSYIKPTMTVSVFGTFDGRALMEDKVISKADWRALDGTQGNCGAYDHDTCAYWTGSLNFSWRTVGSWQYTTSGGHGNDWTEWNVNYNRVRGAGLTLNLADYTFWSVRDIGVDGDNEALNVVKIEGNVDYKNDEFTRDTTHYTGAEPCQTTFENEEHSASSFAVPWSALDITWKALGDTSQDSFPVKVNVDLYLVSAVVPVTKRNALVEDTCDGESWDNTTQSTVFLDIVSGGLVADLDGTYNRNEDGSDYLEVRFAETVNSEHVIYNGQPAQEIKDWVLKLTRHPNQPDRDGDMVCDNADKCPDTMGFFGECMP